MKATLKYGDLLQPPDMVSSTAFDRDDEYFATAGVSRRIKACCCFCVRLAFGMIPSLRSCVPLYPWRCWSQSVVRWTDYVAAPCSLCCGDREVAASLLSYAIAKAAANAVFKASRVHTTAAALLTLL